jgi:8-oxo-dGTP diphosphatase
MNASNRPSTPALTVDIIIEMPNQSVVLIERKHAPHGWALPGGFVDVGETLENAARREAKEETNLNVTLTELLGIYSDPSRDKRGHTVSAVYIATATGEPRAQDDAKNLRICDPRSPPGNLAFDHQTIIDDYLEFKSTGKKPGPG